MPRLWPILTQGFTALMVRFGIQAVPQAPQWELSNTVTPVAIVDPDPIQVVAVNPLWNLPFTFGQLLSPAAAAILADTGALPAGSWEVFILLGNDAAVAGDIDFRIQRRNAANSGDIWVQRFHQSTASTVRGDFQLKARFQLSLNERIRVENVGTTAGVTVQASIFAVQV